MADLDPDKTAGPFEKMAARVRANAPGDFGGAMVLVAPDGRAIEQLVLDPMKDEAAFWALVAAKVDAAKTEFLANEQAKQGGFGGMRR